MNTLFQETRPTLELTGRFPLVECAVAEVALDLEDRGQVMRLIEGGGTDGRRIEWAFDVSHPDAERRSEVRIYWRCIKMLQEGNITPIPEREVLNALFPSFLGSEKAVNLYTRWRVSHQLIGSLVDAGELTAITEAGPGRGGSPKITRASALRFFKTRRMQ